MDIMVRSRFCLMISNCLTRRISSNIEDFRERFPDSSGTTVVVDDGIDNDNESAGTRMLFATSDSVEYRRNAVKNMPVIPQMRHRAVDAYRCSPSDN